MKSCWIIRGTVEVSRSIGPELVVIISFNPEKTLVKEWKRAIDDATGRFTIPVEQFPSSDLAKKALAKAKVKQPWLKDYKWEIIQRTIPDYGEA